MKGLLLKEWYIIKKDCKYLLLLTVIFSLSALFFGDNWIVLFLPSHICGSISDILLSQDSKSRWSQYIGTLPYKKSQIVSAKYLISLLAQIAVLFVVGAAQSINRIIAGNFVPGNYLFLLLLILLVTSLSYTLSLPFAFKTGENKNQAAYYILTGVQILSLILAINFSKKHPISEFQPNITHCIFALVGIGLFLLSWFISVVLYKKSEIQ